MTSLPPLDPQPSGLLVIFSPGSWTWIGDALKKLYTGLGTLGAQQDLATVALTQRLDVVIAALGPLTQTLEGILVAMNDLNTSQGRSEASTSAALAGISREVQQVRDAVQALGDSPSAAELAAFKARIDANTDRLDAAVALLGSDDPAPPAEPTT